MATPKVTSSSEGGGTTGVATSPNKKRSTNVEYTDSVSGPRDDRLRRILAEIESSDGPLGPALRAIYEKDDYEKFMSKLDNRIKQHDRDIERMCNYHYQGFIDSIQELLQVRSQADVIKNQIRETNKGIQRAGQEMKKYSGEAVRLRQVQQNITVSIDQIQTILPVLDVYGKMKEQMKSKRYYAALKTLEQLEHTYLPRVSRFRFVQIMMETIPQLRDQIKEASMSELKDFLESIRKHSSRIGQVAMKQAAEQQDLVNADPGLACQRLKKRKAPAAPKQQAVITSSSPFDDEEDSQPESNKVYDDDDELSAQDLVDFSPVYRCLHIHSILGAREEFENYYRKQRKKQVRLSLQPPGNMHETVDGYTSFFHDVIGFFVVEDHILNTTTGLVTRAFLDDLWEMALQKTIVVLRTHSAICTDSMLLLEIKKAIVLFSHTLQGYGFPVVALYELLQEIRDQYSEILMKQWVAVFETIFDQDMYTPIVADTQAEFSNVVDRFPFLGHSLAKSPFPRQFPFSKFVPAIYHEIKQYILACLRFCQHMNVSYSEMDDMIRKSANMLLTRTLSCCLSALIKKPHIGLKELIQITINTHHLEESCGELEKFISAVSGAGKDGGIVAKLQGAFMFKDIRSEADEEIYRQLNLKIDEFLTLAKYNWLLEESKGHASGYLMDLIAFLQSTFLSFTNLPVQIAQTACMSACKHIASSMMSMLLDSELKQISIGALQQFNLDVIQCEQFSNSEPVPGFTDGALQMAFLELRQILDLFMSWDWSVYFADYGSPTSKYLRVSPHVAITLLEKMKESDKKKNTLFSAMKKTERDKKRLLDTVLKQLKGLTNAATGTVSS